MQIELLYFDGCPNWRVVQARVHEALAQVGRSDVVFAPRRVETAAGAATVEFGGSPTILVNGRDPFAGPRTPVGLSCRVYATPDGLAGSPTVTQIVEVLERQP